MNKPLRLKIKEIRTGLRNAFTRMPFRYGVATLTSVPFFHTAVTVEDEGGRTATGYSSDCFPPKWFDKSPEKDFRQEIEEMLGATRHARAAALDAGEGTAFDIHRMVYPSCLEFGDAQGLTRLTAGFGSSFVDRAVIDAAGRLAGCSFHESVRQNLLGIDLGWYHEELAGVQPGEVVARQPLDHVYVRHTVGLLDYLRDADIPEGELLNDALPQSLEAVIRHYGVTYLKLKVWGDTEKDIDRLAGMVKVIESNVKGDYHCTLDGNENFKDAAGFLGLVEKLRAEERFQRFFESILFIEQPIHRSQALSDASAEVIREIACVKPVIIDESDEEPGSFPRAIDLGYRGVSHKNCKGIYKSIANLALAQKRSARPGEYFLSGEDLGTLPVPALQSDLCAVASLGIPHLERNGHHYYRGLNHLPDSERNAAFDHHPNLYRKIGAETFLNLQDGQLDVRSLQCPGYGIGFDLDMDSMESEDEWSFESLGLT